MFLAQHRRRGEKGIINGKKGLTKGYDSNKKMLPRTSLNERRKCNEYEAASNGFVRV
jgi:hypothetical protein